MSYPLTAFLPDLKLTAYLPDTIETQLYDILYDTLGLTLLDTNGLEITVPGISGALVFHAKMPDLRLSGDI